MAAGITLAAWGVASASSEGVTIDQPAQLVTTGAFAAGRNPMYQGWSMAVAGLGLAIRLPWVLVAAAIASSAVHRAVLDEEAALSRAFGGQYEAYAAVTPRYMPAEGVIAVATRMIRGRTVIHRRRS